MTKQVAAVGDIFLLMFPDIEDKKIAGLLADQNSLIHDFMKPGMYSTTAVIMNRERKGPII